jgi:hypothetical protein
LDATIAFLKTRIDQMRFYVSGTDPCMTQWLVPSADPADPRASYHFYGCPINNMMDNIYGITSSYGKLTASARGKLGQVEELVKRLLLLVDYETRRLTVEHGGMKRRKLGDQGH